MPPTMLQHTQEFLHHEAKFISENQEAYRPRPRGNRTEQPSTTKPRPNDQYHGNCELEVHEVAILNGNNVPFPPETSSAQQRYEQKAAIRHLASSYETQLARLYSENKTLKQQNAHLNFRPHAKEVRRAQQVAVQKAKFDSDMDAAKKCYLASLSALSDETNTLKLKVCSLQAEIFEEVSHCAKVKAGIVEMRDQLREATELVAGLRQEVKQQTCEKIEPRVMRPRAAYDGLLEKSLTTKTLLDICLEEKAALEELNEGLVRALELSESGFVVDGFEVENGDLDSDPDFEAVVLHEAVC